MLFSSPIFSQASGSVAGLTFAHCRAGMTVRSRSTPTNPDTERQRTVKHALARFAPYWGDTLSQDERDAWNLYGSNVVMTNALGKPFHLTGQNHFLRANIPRIQSGLSVLATAPTVFDLGTFTAPVILGAIVDIQALGINFTQTDEWASTAGGHMLVYEGMPTGPGRDFGPGHFRFAGRTDGDPSPPFDPALFVSPWFLTADNILWVQIRIIQPDGRLSLPIILGPVTIVPT
jgi:hypothetical protein